MKKAVLVIHGFVGSLYDNEYLMNYLQFDFKFDVFAKTLPGHHETNNYQKVTFLDWINFVSEAVCDLITMGYQDIYLIGHSMGGVLASYLASKYKQIKKIVFINAAFNYINLKQNKIDILTNKDYKDYIDIFDKALHTSIPFFLEFVKLVKEYHLTLDKICCDTLILQSTIDELIPIENGLVIYDHIKSRNKYLTYLENEKHIVFQGDNLNQERKKLIAEYVRLFLRGEYKWKKIWKERI